MATKRAAKLHLLTAREVLTSGEGDHSDGGGLLLRIRGESCSWVFRFTAPSGRRREMGLGTCHRSNVALAGGGLVSARDEAHRGRELLRQGKDPIDERTGLRGAAAAAEQAKKVIKARAHWTLARSARDYHEREVEPVRTDKHGAQWISSLENHVPAAVWHKPIEQIEAPELLQALLAIKPHERARNLTDGRRLAETIQRVRQRLDAVFEDAIFHKRCVANPAAAIRRKLRGGLPREVGGGNLRALPYREAPAFLRALREQQGTAARCLELLLFTAARTSEAIELEADELDLESAHWLCPAPRMKAREEHDVYLPPTAVTLLRAQLALRLHPRIVFPSPANPDAPLSNMALLAVLNRMGYRDRTTVHGFRSTFSTWANETGAGRPDVIEACLAHSERDKVRASYNRSKFAEERRALLAAWAEFLGSPAAKVLRFESAQRAPGGQEVSFGGVDRAA